MGLAIQTYTPDLIHNFDRLKTLFTGEKELAEIDQLPEEALVRPKDFHYFNRWQVAWIVMASPFTFIFFLFLKTVATIFDCLFIRSLSNRLHLIATHLLRNIDYLYIQACYGSSLWVPSLNDYQWNLSDVYNQWNIKREEILEPRIRNKLNKAFDGVQYCHIDRGLCWGGVFWFNYLLLKQLQKGKNGIEAIVGVAKQFETGQPRQAALIQSIYGLQNDLLDMSNQVTKITPSQLRDKTYMVNAIKKLKNGVYTFQLPAHAVSYIKLAGKDFIWDPDGGLIAIETAEDLLEFIYDHRKGKEDTIFFTKQTLKWGILNRIRNLLP